MSTFDLESKMVPQDIPVFEGRFPSETRLKISGASNLEVNDFVINTEEICTVTLDVKCIGVNHVLDKKTDEYRRIQTVEVINAFVK